MQLKKLFSTIGAAGLALGISACGDTEEFMYGKDQPGLNLEEGGEIRFERIKTPGGPVVLAQTFFIEAAKGNFPLPDVGKCNRVSDANGNGIMWPVPNMTEKVYTDVGDTLTLTGAGKTLTFNKYTKTATGPALPGNDPSLRRHDIIYGGPAQSSGAGAMGPDVWSADDLVYDTSYDIAYSGEPKLTQPKVYLPRDYTIESPSIGSAPVTFKKGQDAVFKYDSLAPAADDVEHTADRAFPFTIFIDTSKGLFTHICLAPVGDGGQHTIPASVFDEVPAEGWVLHGQLSHYLDDFKGRRFDTLGVSCNLSPFTVE